MKKTQITMSKPVYLRLSMLDLSKTVIYEFWYDYIKSKNGENVKLCYMGTDSLIVHLKTDDTYKDIVEDVETRFDISNYKTARPTGKDKNRQTHEEKIKK